MPRQRRSRAPFIVAASTIALALACAVSEPIDFPVTQQAGTSGSDNPGDRGAAGTDGGNGVTGLGGSTGFAGSGGTQSTITSGEAGTGDAAGTTGKGGSNVSGQAGSSGGAADGMGGTTGRGGAGGLGARGGSTGFGGRGGSVGSGGRGGALGTAGTSGAADGGANPDAGAAPTFTEIYTTILVVYCSGSSCHNPGSQRGISFASKSTAYTAVRSRVTPGNGAGSSLYTTVNSGRMPPGGVPAPTAAEIAKLKAWIDAGALNN
jgi:hypothetical protein